MRSRSTLIRLSTVAIVLLQVGCASPQKLTRTHVPEDISLEELRKEMRSTNQFLYGFGGAVLTGAAGLVSGGFIGSKVGEMAPCRSHCGENGFYGLIYGGTLGLAGGIILGGIYYSRSGIMKDLRQATKRIRQRRDAESTSIGRSEFSSVSPSECTMGIDWLGPSSMIVFDHRVHTAPDPLPMGRRLARQHRACHSLGNPPSWAREADTLSWPEPSNTPFPLGTQK